MMGLRICFIANHCKADADDEGAVAYALRELGHEVVCIQERRSDQALNCEADLCLFFKWADVSTIRRLRMKKVFWYFDRVDDPDPVLAGRCSTRKAWMETVTPTVDLGFCTDGDWVAQDRSGKLITLRQGFDARVVGKADLCGLCAGPYGETDILFTGIAKNGGVKRESFVAEMHERWGGRFRHVKGGVYRENLAGLIARTKIVVAPDGPGSPKYWSNRVYNVLGMGGFLLHPFSPGLALEYEPDMEIKFYHDRQQLHDLIEVYGSNQKNGHRFWQAGNAKRRTHQEHTYRHRCAELMRIVQERLF